MLLLPAPWRRLVFLEGLVAAFAFLVCGLWVLECDIVATIDGFECLCLCLLLRSMCK
jgi:hypothetical protein